MRIIVRSLSRFFLFFSASVLTARTSIAEPLAVPLSAEIVSHLAPRLSASVAAVALNAVACASREGKAPPSTLAIIDYSLPSTEPRFWLLDLEHKQLLLEELVAHGRGSGENLANRFSNDAGSLSSSLGLFRIGDSYVGSHGPSLRLIGLEQGYNDHAYDRAIVLHGADYVSSDFISQHQRLGRSWGCPALAPNAARKAIDYLQRGASFLFVYYPDANWLKASQFIKGCGQ